MDFLPIFQKMLELFTIIVIGYLAVRFRIVNDEIKQALTRVVLYISLPCTILSSVMNAETLPGIRQIGKLLVVAFLSYLLYFILAKITGRLLGFKGRDRGAAEFALMFSNVGFIGYPVTYAVFGPPSVFYTCVFNMPFNVLCYSLGVILINTGKETEKLNLHRLMMLLISPSMITSVIALAMALIGVQGPAVLGETCEMVGGITTPGALLIIGIVLGQMPLKEMFINVKAYLFGIISVLVVPVTAGFLFAPLCAGDPLLLGELVVISGMPVATAGTMLSVQHGGNEKLMAQLTFLSTLFSVITIPLIATFL